MVMHDIVGRCLSVLASVVFGSILRWRMGRSEAARHVSKSASDRLFGIDLVETFDMDVVVAVLPWRIASASHRKQYPQIHIAVEMWGIVLLVMESRRSLLLRPSFGYSLLLLACMFG